jgi:hypothetical protein
MRKAVCVDDAVTFTNSARRVINGWVTKVEGPWVTVWETGGSCYKLPISAVTRRKEDA